VVAGCGRRFFEPGGRPEHGAFECTYFAAEGKVGLLEWTYHHSVRVRDGDDSYPDEDGNIVAPAIHYTLEKR
jgi:hypothetical protein